MLKSLAYIGITSAAGDVWAKDGPEVYGFELMPTASDGAVRLRMDDVHHRISIHPGSEDDLRYLGWDVGGPVELEIAATRLRDLEFAVHDGEADLCADRRVGGLIWFHDPLGFRHELVWGQLTAPGNFRPGRGISGFVTGELGLGHVVLIVPDLAYEKFLTGVLGFRITDQLIGQADVRFYHINPRHHTIGFAVLPGKVGFHHLMVQVRDIADVGVAYELALERGIRMAQTLGHHGNDRTTSFYARSPSGFELEYGCGSREVHDSTWIVETYDRMSIWGHHSPKDGRIPSEILREHSSQEQ